MNHDQLFKELLQAFLPEFVALTLPGEAALIDWSRLEFLSPEEFTDSPVGDRRTMDLVARVATTAGEPELLLLHLEIEAAPRRDFPARMFEYYSLLRLRRRLPIVPIAICLRPGFGGITVGRYVDRPLSLPVLQFQYHLVALPDLRGADLDATNPLAHVFWSFVKDRPSDRVERRLRAYRGIARTTTDSRRRSLLLGFAEAYTELSPEERAELRRRAQAAEEEGVSLLIPEVVKEALEEGRAEGRVQALRDAVLQVARARLGELPKDVEEALGGLQSDQTLRDLLPVLAGIESVSELRGRLGLP